MDVAPEVVVEGGLVRVAVSGTMSPERLREVMALANRVAADHAARGILVDFFRADCTIPVADLYDVGKWIARGPGRTRCRTALVPTRGRWEHGRFLALTASNHGALIEAFRTARSAARWLGS